MRNLNIGLKQFKDLLSKIKFRFLFNAKTEIRVNIEPIKRPISKLNHELELNGRTTKTKLG